ncbi:unnamed protein product [Acanthoscelides obtectus]|uniref:Peptidase C1A papain C-terminal domain-containing protein n=1 Tax=Acanthoscelides obtectus TaxID=200917 RepID=A0A9P0Q3V1_ACAOB|nr:unnamed protein product [Acanthoscelides obtectus]CAK1631674.1 Cathepsin S [Acanthoscelides obtectus]
MPLVVVILPKTEKSQQVFDESELRFKRTLDSLGRVTGVGAIKVQIFLKNGILEPLSVQNFIDCSTGEYDNKRCSGGLMNNGLNYTRDHGVLTDKEYQFKSYFGKEGKCKKQGGVKISGVTSRSQTEMYRS